MGKWCWAMEGVEVSQTLGVTREVGRGNLSGLGLARRRRDGSELEVRQRSIKRGSEF